MREPSSRILQAAPPSRSLRKSSNGGAERNGRAGASFLTGLLAAAALPVAIAVAETTELLELLDASGAIPVAGGLGIAALVLARSARLRAERTLGRVGGEGAARAGRVLGVVGICLAIAGAIAVGFYFALQHYE